MGKRHQFDVASGVSRSLVTARLGPHSCSSGERTRRQRMDTAPAFRRGVWSSRFFAGPLSSPTGAASAVPP